MQVEDLEEGLLACLSAAGHQETALRRSEGLLHTAGSELGSVVHPAAIESAWRLGKWNALDGLL